MVKIIVYLIGLFVTSSAFASNNILIIGDSISAGFGLQTNESWVTLLQSRIDKKNYPYKVINASISGDTTSSALNRIDYSLNTHKPSIVILELGGNDGLRGLNLKKMKSNLSKMVAKSHDINAKVLLVGMNLPPNYGKSFIKRFANTYQQIAAELKTALVPFLFDGFESNRSYFQADGIHPTADAQGLLLDNVWPHLLPLLDNNQ